MKKNNNLLAALCALPLMAGCSTFKANIDVHSVGGKSGNQLTTEIIDPKGNIYVGETPFRVTIKESFFIGEEKEKPFPLIVKTKCGYTYYQLVAITNWVDLDSSDADAQNKIVFKIDESDEDCVR